MRARSAVLVPFSLLLPLLAGCAANADGEAAAAARGRGGEARAKTMGVSPVDIDRPWRPEDRESVPPAATDRLEELPLEAIRGLERDLTLEEVVAILGEPCSRETLAQDTDREGRDWNGLVVTWRYQDSRHTSMDMPRDLRARFVLSDNRRPWPRRPAVIGPRWMLFDWTLE